MLVEFFHCAKRNASIAIGSLNVFDTTSNRFLQGLRPKISINHTTTAYLQLGSPHSHPGLHLHYYSSVSNLQNPSLQPTEKVPGINIGGFADTTTSNMDAKALSRYMLPLETPVAVLDCTQAFNGLTEQEKLYAYYLSQASWVGGLIAFVQTSPEAPAIFCLLHDLFKSNGVEELKNVAVGECAFTEDEWTALLVYAGGVFANAGNYKAYGDTKIIPGVPLDKLEALLSKAKFLGHERDHALKTWNEIKDKVYSLSAREKQLGLGEKGITTFFSSNCTHADADLINRFMKKQGIEGYITRCFKTIKDDKVSYEIRSASAKTDAEEPKTHAFEGCEIRSTRGDYSPLMKKVCESLEKAQKHALNETERKMVKCYVESFNEGSLDAHKDGSRYWIKDKGPIVETYIGFIETYRDPAGIRGEFRGFVSVVNRQMSVKFTSLVEKAPELLKLLPWPRELEKDEFLKPDFTSLDVITFAGSKVPAGTNVPNYDEIRQSEGFKNLSLGNVIISSSSSSKNPIPFLSDKDQEILKKYRVSSFEVQVGLHELLGHGSGKLFKKNPDGTTNCPSDLKNPLTGDLIEGTYEEGETYDSVFTTLGSAFEECRAECVGLFLCVDKTVIKIFGWEGEEADAIIYANWLDMIFAGLKALEMYQSETAVWMQAHSQARFVILQVLLDAGEGFVHIVEKTGTDGNPDLMITLDGNKINSVGRKAMADFLLKQQVYKSTADIKSARKMFDKYSAVNNEGQHPWAKWRDIVLDKKKPPRLLVQPNLFLNNGDIQLKSYDSSLEGSIHSWIERFQDLSIYEDLEYCRLKDKPYFTY
ncbi:unnamed protein product [Orchesella dallaii]|uniref:Dipeptidyl aminopeptidase III n=1 Tax=Orchesella dallaii TaxID=48710 RepID=A0ABP1QAT5_9HEXA